MADSGLTLGTAVVEIGGDLTKLVAAFAEARKMRDAFDSDMVAASGGLLKLTTAADEAADALDTDTTKIKDAGDAAKTTAKATDDLTDAKNRATKASKDSSDALDIEAQKVKILDASMVQLSNPNRIRPTGAGPLIGSTTSKEPGLLDAQNALMGISGGKIPGLGAAADDIKPIEDEVEKLGQKTKISSTAIREMIVLIREAGRGDFTRMAGSASLLAQNLGAVEAIGAPVLASLAALAIVVGVVGVAMFEAAKETRLFENSLALTGNRAGLTAGNYEDMAVRIGQATNTSIASNKTLISDLANTNNFSKEQIETLVTSAQAYAKATDQSATDVVKDFEKMAEGPTKYALEFQKAHIGIITPVEMNHIRELEERGDKEAALAELIKDVTDGIAKNTVENLGLMERAWTGFFATLSNGWTNIKGLFETAPLETQIASLDAQIMKVNATLNNDKSITNWAGELSLARRSNEDLLKSLTNQRAGLQEQLNAQEKATAASQKTTVANQAQAAGIAEVNASYLKGIDAPQRYQDAITKLNYALADSVKMARDTPIGDVLAAASKSADNGVRDLATHYQEAVDKIKKENLPDVFKADSKAARDAASALKKLETAAASLEKQRQQAITTASNENATLTSVLALYKNQALSLDDVNRAKAVTAALSKLKLSADSDEGKQVVALTGANLDLNKAIADETKKRQDLLAIRSKTDSIELETQLLGKYGEEVVYETIMLQKLNDAKRQHIKLTDDDILAIQKEARAQATAQGTLDKAKFAQDYAGGAVKQPTGSDMRSIDTLLGGKSQIADSQKTITAALNQQKATLKTAYEAGLISYQDYLEKRKKLTAIAAADEQKALDASKQMQIDGAISIATSLESIASDVFGKKSAAYKVAFDLEKTFTIAKAALAIEQDIAEATAKGFPANIPLIAQAVAEGATIISSIRSIALNLADGGMIRGAGTGTSDSIPVNASDGEFMVNAQSTVQWRTQLEDINAGRMPNLPGQPGSGGAGRGPSVTINNLAPNTSHDVSTGLTMDDVVITARRIVASDAPKAVAADLRSPNSRTSKALQTNTTTTRRRR